LALCWHLQQEKGWLNPSRAPACEPQQHFPADDDEQQVLPQQQPEALAAIPIQKCLTCPFGQRQSKCGRPVIGTMIAVNQTWPMAAIFPKAHIYITPVAIFAASLRKSRLVHLDANGASACRQIAKISQRRPGQAQLNMLFQ
jgi:hypothetical protein